MSTHLKITLPLPGLGARIFYEKLIPPALMPGGMHTLTVCLLENQEGADYFVKACFDLMETALQELPEDLQSTYEAFVIDSSYLTPIRLGLEIFYEQYLGFLRNLFADRSMQLVRVLSYRLRAGVCVELKEDRHGAVLAG
jgi:hypothetical protein